MVPEVGFEPTHCGVHYDYLLKQICFTDKYRYPGLFFGGTLGNRTLSPLWEQIYSLSRLSNCAAGPFHFVIPNFHSSSKCKLIAFFKPGINSNQASNGIFLLK